MALSRRAALGGSLALLGGCGFRPLYAPAEGGGAGPASAAGGTPVPMFMACKGEASPSGIPIRRLSQPVRVVDPGAASSRASMAEKCERLGAGSPEAWTHPSLPVFHSGMRGASAGCMPKNASAARS